MHERILLGQPEIILFDGDPPSKEAMDFLRAIRPHFSGPVVIFASTVEEGPQIEAYRAGADDYLPRLSSSELVESRLHAILRRSYPQPTQTLPGFYLSDAAALGPRRVETGALIVDRSSRAVALNGRIIKLSSQEFSLLWILARNAGLAVARGHLFRILTGRPWDGMDRAVDVLILRLRRKLHDNARHPEYIKSVHGVGYLLAKQESRRNQAGRRVRTSLQTRSLH